VSRTEYEALLDQARWELASAADTDELEAARITWLGRKGRIPGLMRTIPDLPEAERPVAGRMLNQIKSELAALLEERRLALAGTSGDEEQEFDLTHPGRTPFVGRMHPITRTLREIVAVFREMGFDVVEGPEVESDYYNFEALNMPPHHPARGMWDTFYTKVPRGMVLRTHTSPVQIRTMEQCDPPVRIIVPGRCYRTDTPDATHSPVFYQVEGLYVDQGVSLAMLRGVLDTFAHRIFGADVPTRFRPSYFPFTEPSAELDIQCVGCGGGGCRMCKGTGWLEILGAGMVNPDLYGFVGYDPENVSGYAFGMGVERIAILRQGVEDIRLYYENNLRFLEQL